MPFFLAVVAHTPIWVWALFAYLVWAGLRSLQPRTSSLARLLIVPACFSADGLLLLRSLDGAGSAAVWVAATALALPLGLAFGPRVLHVDRAGWTVALGRSAVPLARNIGLFVLQYGAAVGAAIHPHQRGAWALVGVALSGLSLGYFAGWTAALARAWRGADTAA